MDAAMPKLTFRNGPVAGHEIELAARLLVGRGPLAELSLDEPSVSRRHAAVFQSGEGYMVEDLGSGNGTRLNGQRLRQPALLRDGDEVKFGSVAAVFHDAMTAAVTRTAARLAFGGEGGYGPVLMAMKADVNAAAVFGEHEHEQRLEAAERRLRFATELARVASQGFDEERLLHFVLEELFKVMPQAERGFLLVKSAGSGELAPSAARTRSGEAAEIQVSRALVQRVVERKEGVLCADVSADVSLAALRTLRQLKIRSLICVPLVAEEEVLGVLQVDNATASRPFDKPDMALMVGVAGAIALALANSRLHAKLLQQEIMQRDLALARRIQQRFLPPAPPRIPGLEFAVEYLPAFEIGGDYYDFLSLPAGRIGLALADVSGKGISAALCMAKLSSELRYQSAGRSETVDILRAVDRAMAAELEEGMFVTLQIAALDPASGRCELGNSGHLPPIIKRSGGSVEVIDMPPGAPVGLALGRPPGRVDFELGRGDVAVLYTDGVTEATRADGALFETERLCAAIERAAGSPSAVLQSVLLAVRDFIAGAPQSDDITLVTLSAGQVVRGSAPLGQRTTKLPAS